MKKKLAVVIIFIIILVFPMVTWPIASQLNLPTVDENREKAKFPQFGNDVFTQFDKYFADRAPYRDALIKMYKDVERQLKLLYEKMLPDDVDYYTEINKVLFGQEDWLFYTGDDSLAYYKGTNLPTEAELQGYVARAEKVNEYFKAQGKEFVIFIAPNKEQIYSEYMPINLHVKNKIKRADMIYDYFRKHSDVKVLYPKDELIEAKKDGFTYLQEDTHWNDFGAYIGAKSIFDALHVALGDVEITDIPWTGGDLPPMAALTPSKYTAYNVNYRPDVTLNYLDVSSNGYKIESSNKNGKHLFVFGDSFTLADYTSSGEPYRVGLKGILSKEYETSSIYHKDRFGTDDTHADEIDDATTVIFEAVERYEQSIFADWGLLQRFINVYGL